MSGALQSKIAAIDKENIPAADRAARIKELKQGGEVRRAASRDESRYEDETSMIYGAYKRNMLETKEDQREEVRLPPRPTRSRSGEQSCCLAGEGCAERLPPLPPPSRTNWTRLVPPSVLIGRVSSLLPY